MQKISQGKKMEFSLSQQVYVDVYILADTLEKKHLLLIYN